MTNINFPDHAQDRETYPENTYKVVLDRWEKVVAKTGTEQIRWYSNIEGGDYDGKSAVDHLQLLDNTGWKIANFLKACYGFDNDDLKALGKVNTGSARFARMMDLCKGRKMWWTLIIDSYGGSQRNKVSDYIPVAIEEQPKLNSTEIDDIPTFIKEKEQRQNK